MSDCCATKPVEAATPAAQTEADCPQCAQPGKSVERITLKQIVRPEFLELVNKPGFQFCRSAHCDVVYFHPDGDVLRKRDVRVRVTQKETEDPVPICYCFGFTERMALEEIMATGKCTIPQRITAEIKAGHCACDIRNPQGSCCLGNVNEAVKRAQQVAAELERATVPAERSAS